MISSLLVVYSVDYLEITREQPLPQNAIFLMDSPNALVSMAHMFTLYNCYILMCNVYPQISSCCTKKFCTTGVNVRRIYISTAAGIYQV